MLLIQARLALVGAFRNARGVMDHRDVVFVSVGEGWGEAAPFPGSTSQTVDDVWESLRSAAPTGVAAAACDEAHVDDEARSAGVLLAGDPALPLSKAVGLDDHPGEAAAAAHAAGFGAVKLKIALGADCSRVTAARTAAPDLTIGVDANGGYPTIDVETFTELDALGVAYVEQPYAPGNLEAHAALRPLLDCDLALDEDVHSVADARDVVAAGAADLLVVKPGVLGYTGALEAYEVAIASGLGIKASGLIETSLGRSYTGALAALPRARYSDLAPASAFLEIDPVRPSAQRAGIGVEPDRDVLEPLVVREARVG